MKEFEIKNLYAIHGKPGIYRYVGTVNKSNLLFSRLIDDKQKVLTSRNAGIVHFANVVVYTHDGQMPLEQVFERLYELKESGNIPEDFDNLTDDARASFMELAVPKFDGGQFKAYHMTKILKWFSEISVALDMLNDGVFDPYEKQEENDDKGEN